ncbi:MAG: hypothetical protein HYZ49_19560 [Chloroflexi bacterium]|nr:hypothetical protein [Chloroflexota bacterium]
MNSLLTLQPIARVRRNHGLEHATIHVLTARKRRSMAGYSDANGFWLLGDLPTDEVEAAAHEALKRMKGGEHDLAIHPNCGTNFVTAGTFAGLAAFVSLIGARTWRDKLERLPLTLAFATAAIVFAQPVGLRLQAEITTNGVMGEMEIASVKKVSTSPAVMHRIETRG